jgi:hypothetical protein
LFHYLINKEYSGVQSFVFITTRKDQPCSLRVDPPSEAARGNPLSPKNSHCFSKHAFFELLQKRELSHRSTRPQEHPKAQGSSSREITYASKATVPPLTPHAKGRNHALSRPSNSSRLRKSSHPRSLRIEFLHDLQGRKRTLKHEGSRAVRSLMPLRLWYLHSLPYAKGRNRVLSKSCENVIQAIKGRENPNKT